MTGNHLEELLELMKIADMLPPSDLLLRPPGATTAPPALRAGTVKTTGAHSYRGPTSPKESKKMKAPSPASSTAKPAAPMSVKQAYVMGVLEGMLVKEGMRIPPGMALLTPTQALGRFASWVAKKPVAAAVKATAKKPMVAVRTTKKAPAISQVVKKTGGPKPAKIDIPLIAQKPATKPIAMSPRMRDLLLRLPGGTR